MQKLVIRTLDNKDIIARLGTMVKFVGENWVVTGWDSDANQIHIARGTRLRSVEPKYLNARWVEHMRG